MAKEQANYRIDAKAKQEAYKCLAQMGIKPTDAVNMFMHHIAMFQELPFQPRVPNKETLQTFAQTDAEKELETHKNADDMFARLNI